MNVTTSTGRVTRSLPALGALLIVTSIAGAQQPAATKPPAPAAAPANRRLTGPAIAKLVAEPARVAMRAGETVPLKITGYDEKGEVVAGAQIFVQASRQALSWADGKLHANRAGVFTATAMAFGGAQPVTLDIPVTITWPNIAKLEIVPEPGRLYTDVTLAHNLKAWHADSSQRPEVVGTWRSSNPSVASVDRFGNVTALKTGSATITAEVDGMKAEKVYTVVTNPVTKIDIDLKDDALKTGDVVHLAATAHRAGGAVVADAPITWSYSYVPDDSLVAGGVKGGPGIIQFGRFAANIPGRFTLLAQSGSAHAQKVIQVAPRDVRQRITVTSRGTIHSTHTSDLWPWTGKDGRDYCIVGTWGGDGYAIIFDITDVNNIVKTDSIKVDARTINDVTVSPDGRYAVMSREGASNRINGVVFLDLATPAHPKVASSFDQELTGGVHNMFATNDNLFAVSGGAKYVIIDTKDIYHPKYVSEYRHPNARIHDLWVRDGIAYSAQGGVGAVAVDVGNGKYGGTIEHPKLIAVYPVNSGHEIYPYYQKSTGKMYLFLGDEEMNRRGRVWEGSGYSLSGADGNPPKNSVAQTSGGYTHIVDFTDPMHPVAVGRYQLEDYGSHDIIVENDVLYQAYYDGGVRVVDVSGELMGNLTDQGREIAVFKSYDPDGYTANAPFVMNAMPWKGKVLFTDFNSGLWSAKLEPKTPPIP